MSTREVINYLKAKKAWIDGKYTGSKMTMNKGNKESTERHQKLITAILDHKSLRNFSKKVKVVEEKKKDRISTSQSFWNNEYNRQKFN